MFVMKFETKKNGARAKWMKFPSFPFFRIVCDKVEKTGWKEKLMYRLIVTPVAQLAVKSSFATFVPVFRFARLGLGQPFYFHSTVHAQKDAASFV